MRYTCPHCAPRRVDLYRTFTPAGERCFTCWQCGWTCAARVAATAAIRHMRPVRTRRCYASTWAFPDLWAEITHEHHAYPDEVPNHRALLRLSVAGRSPFA